MGHAAGQHTLGLFIEEDPEHIHQLDERIGEKEAPEPDGDIQQTQPKPGLALAIAHGRSLEHKQHAQPGDDREDIGTHRIDGPHLHFSVVLILNPLDFADQRRRGTQREHHDESREEPNHRGQCGDIPESRLGVAPGPQQPAREEQRDHKDHRYAQRQQLPLLHRLDHIPNALVLDIPGIDDLRQRNRLARDRRRYNQPDQSKREKPRNQGFDARNRTIEPMSFSHAQRCLPIRARDARDAPRDR